MSTAFQWWHSGERAKDEPHAEDVNWHERVLDEVVAEDSISEDIEHVVPIIRESEWVDNGIVVYDDKPYATGKKIPDDCSDSWKYGRRFATCRPDDRECGVEELEKGRVEEREGEERDEDPEIEHLR